jgi:hypothetical protein
VKAGLGRERAGEWCRLAWGSIFVVLGVGRCSGDGQRWRRGSPAASASAPVSWPAVEVSKRLGRLQWSCEDVEEGFRGFKGRRN